jgi:hypothetical protein
MAILDQIPAERIIAGDRKLAEILKKSRMTISNWKKDGKINYLKINDEYFYDSARIFATPEEREQPCQK